MLDRQTTLELARLLNEVVVSGDRIASTYHDDEDTAAREWLAYCQTIDFWRASRRSLLLGTGALVPEPL